MREKVGIITQLGCGNLSKVYFKLYVILLFVGACFSCDTPAKLGLLVSENTCCNYLSYEDKGGAFNIAFKQLKKDHVLQDNCIIDIVWKDTRLVSDGVGNVVDLVRDENVDVIFGSPSSRVNIPAAHLTSHWNFPHISWSSNSYELSDKSQFTTFIRTIGPLSDTSKTLVTLFRTFHWNKIGLLYVDDGLCQYSAAGIKDRFAEANMTIMQSIGYPSNTILTDVMIDEYLALIKRTSRIIFLCDGDELRRLMIRAYLNGMCNGDYLFIFTDLDLPSKNIWQRNDKYDEIAMNAFKTLFFITPATWSDEAGRLRLEKFHEEVIDRLSEPPWNSTFAKQNGIPASRSSQRVYEATYLYGLWLNYSYENNIDKRDGRAMFRFTKNLSFDGISGPCDMGLSGDRLPYFWIHQFVGDEGDVEIVAISQTKIEKITELTGYKWYTSDGSPPVDVPRCGYFNELCQEQTSDNTALYVIVTMGVMILGAVGGGGGYIIRKRKIDEELLQSIWKVKLDDVDVQKSKAALGSRKSFKSMTALQGAATNASSESSLNLTGEVLMTTVAMFKGQMVSLRNVHKRHILADDLYQLKAMREMVHDNINPFIGACFDTPSPFVLFIYCPKGSLQDILENDEIKLDTTFKYSLTMDLVEGMIFIHSSKILVHGRLKSSNCVVNNRWMLKITDFGLQRFLDNTTDTSIEDHQKYKNMLWTAPELLADNVFIKTKEADVYSFGIILHEIFYRLGPFAGRGNMTAKDIVGRVRNRENEPCRPEIFTDILEVSKEIMRLMQLCWHDIPSERPTFNIIKTYMKKHVTTGTKGNIVDVILDRLEKYANNLEELVDQRTQQLMQEKQKTDKLLYRMLPRSCADKLKLGETVHPELFDSATVFFSDIVGFTTVASRSTPMQVVDLLNDLYTCFDAIIEKYDAYKVETIGDAYLVVSGIPSRNGNQHAGIIADMSLDIVDDVALFKIKHLPLEIVKVRIGMHTGPCCAGVVGLSMPRYCLFGDTVNTASRMESNGLANKIHISEYAYDALNIIGGYETTFRNEMEIKGKGLMKTYWLEGSDHRGTCGKLTPTFIE